MDECSSIWVALIDGATTALVVLAVLAFAYIYFVNRKTAEAVIDHDVRLITADAVKVQVHDAEPGGAVHDLPSVESVVPQVGKLALVHAGTMADYVVVAANRKPPVPQAGSQMVAPGSGRMTSTMA